MAKNKVLVVGSVALDNVKTPFGDMHNVLGGAASYSSVAASFFAPVNLVGVVGEDFPAEHIEFLLSHGIDLTGLQYMDGKTFRWSGYYEYDMNQAHTVDTQLNVFQQFKPQIPESYRESEFVFLANIDPELQLQVLDQIKAPKLVVCDTMNFWITNKKEALLEVLKRVDVAFMNDAEARQLCDTFSIVKAANMIRELGPATVVVKKGEHGAVMMSEDKFFSAPSYPIEEVKDPTGAGDSFAGGFIGYTACNGDICEKTFRQAIIYGSTLASFNVQDFSLRRMSSLTRSDILGRYCEFQNFTHFDAIEE